jgi:D-lactate dehydrogenase (cytochrome)
MSVLVNRRREGAALDALIAELCGLLGNRVSTAAAVRETHGHGEGLADTMLPDVVVFAGSTEDVVTTVKTARRFGVPVIPFGVGTSLEGQVQALHGGISLDLSGMDRVLAINEADLDCRVEAGVTREALNHAIRDKGLFFPLDPGANATLGGMAATRASGTNAVRYGTMREVTLGLTVVTAQGEIIRTGTRARKSSAGYDLTRLYVGSEGTLGIITELQLRLFGIPETIAAGVCQFDTLRGAVEAVTLLLQMGIPLARIELLDELQMRACIAYLADSYMRVPTGFLIEGATAAEQTAMIGAARIDKAHARCGPLALREALNKIAHYRSGVATFRVDRRGAHYLVLGGSRNGRHWIAEILVTQLCRNAAAAAAAIRSHP